MERECCHQHPDNGDLATQTPAQTEETDLRAINDLLLEALGKVAHDADESLTQRPNDLPTILAVTYKQVRDAIKEARK